MAHEPVEWIDLAGVLMSLSQRLEEGRVIQFQEFPLGNGSHKGPICRRAKEINDIVHWEPETNILKVVECTFERDWSCILSSTGPPAFGLQRLIEQDIGIFHIPVDEGAILSDLELDRFVHLSDC